jgi:hypothetical protein
MARKTRFSIPYPRLGVDRSGAFNNQPNETTPQSLNCWVMDPGTDRYRGGMRPVLKSIGSVGGAPYAWCRATYLDGSSITQTGIAVTYASGTRISLTGADWGTPPAIAIAPGTNFSSCAVYLGYLIQARGGSTTYVKELPAGTDDVLTATAGTAPTKCGIIIAHADRLWLMGDTDNPHLVYASAVGDLFDWDYTDPTEGGAFVSSGPEGGIVGEPIIAAISHDDNWLLMGSTDSIYAANGNPKVGGLVRVHDSVGPLTNRAWCKGEGPNGSNDTYLMTRSGFGVIRQGTLQFENLSDARNIRDLKGLNPGTPSSVGAVSGDEVVVGYDGRWKVVHIFVNPSSGDDYGYAYDVRTGAFQPQTFSTTISLIPSLPKLQTEQRSTALPVTHTGTLHQYDSAEDQGSGNETFPSELFFMVPLADDGNEGILHTLTASLAQGSENVDWGVYVGDTAEQAYRKAEADTSHNDADFEGSQWSYTSTRYLNHVQHPRMKGGWACIKVRDVNNERWLIETLYAEVVASGRRRV